MSTLDELRRMNIAAQKRDGAEPPEAAAEETPDIYPDSQIDKNIDSKIDRKQDRRLSDYPERSSDADDHARLRDALAEARKTPVKNVNFKLPTGLDDAIAEYIAENWKSRPLKQDIIAWGIQLALLRLWAGVTLGDLGEEGNQ